jgi:hypothetical protein
MLILGYVHLRSPKESQQIFGWSQFIWEELKQILEGLLALNASDAWEDLEEAVL